MRYPYLSRQKFLALPILFIADHRRTYSAAVTEKTSYIQGVAVYAVVKTGGKQYRVAEGDVFEVEKLAGAPGDEISFPALLLVNDGTVTADAKSLEKVAVKAEVVDHAKGPKIKIMKYKNKTGYKKRQGHRQPLTIVKVTGITSGK
nr:50S ribosomal protein L21 [Antricoccus suffuscus]